MRFWSKIAPLELKLSVRSGSVGACSDRLADGGGGGGAGGGGEGGSCTLLKF